MGADEAILQMSPRVRAEMRDGLVTLNILNAVPEDSGVYRILVRNPESEITCSCTVNVYETIKPTATAPLFTSSVKGMNFRDCIEHHLSSISCFFLHQVLR